MDLVGRVLGGRYEIVRRIGVGGMGTVYEAVQEGLGRRVAVKVLTAALAEAPKSLERFRREALAAAQLGHPNLVRVTDFQQQDGEPTFLVMELLDGEGLDARLERGRLEPLLAVNIASQILAGLEAAHAEGIVHRDLKPANIFLVPMGQDRVLAKVLDFGIAKLMRTAVYKRLTQTGALVGTPRFAAPEQLVDSSAADLRADIYAVGTLLYFMLTGRAPHLSQGFRLLAEVQSRKPTDPRGIAPQLSAALAAVVQKAMEKDRADRFASAREFADALAPLADGGAIHASLPALVPRSNDDATAVMADPPVHAPETLANSPLPTVPEPSPRSVEEATAPDTRPPVPAQPQPSSPESAQPQPSSPQPAQPPSSSPQPSSPQVSTPQLSSSQVSLPGRPPQAQSARRPVVVAVAILGALLGILLLGGIGGVWLVSRTRGETAQMRERSGAAPVPAACREWVRIACECPDRSVVDQFCTISRGRIAAMERGVGGDGSDCGRLLESIHLVCQSGMPAGSPSPPPAGAAGP